MWVAVANCSCAQHCCVFCAAVKGYIKLALDAGKANPAPPVGPALGAKVCQAHLLVIA